MKKYILSAIVVCSATVFTSCNDMLDTDPRVTDATQATFPGKIGDVEALNTATYSIMNTMGGGDADTQACIAGGIAEAYYGMPDDLVEDIGYHLLPAFKDVIIRLAENSAYRRCREQLRRCWRR